VTAGLDRIRTKGSHTETKNIHLACNPNFRFGWVTVHRDWHTRFFAAWDWSSCPESVILYVQSRTTQDIDATARRPVTDVWRA
jgi:hypothetical protein